MFTLCAFKIGGTDVTQEEKIMQYLKRHGSITQREAIFLGIYRLGARIFDMKQAGEKISVENIRVRNMDGSHSYVARYSLMQEEGETDGGR